MTDNAGGLCSGAKAAADFDLAQHPLVDEAMLAKVRPAMHDAMSDRGRLDRVAVCEKCSNACDRVLLGFEIRRFGNQHACHFRLSPRTCPRGRRSIPTSPESSTFGMEASIR